jgi:SAM-dependent methyltransferase
VIVPVRNRYPSGMNKLAVADYLKATRSVEGWFFPIDATLFGMIDEIQKREGISGNLFEIGVHHGKTSIALARMAAPGESVGVCDVFERQELNADNSGEGSRELFETNMRLHGRLPADELHIFAKRSDGLTPEETTTGCRFFHIDGGHRAEDVVADLTTASRALRPDGVVVLDDVFNPNWPGVGEGYYQFHSEQREVFVPIVIGGNKVFFARPAAAEIYERHWSGLRGLSEFYDGSAFAFDFKEWQGHRVLTAIRKAWVDLDPAVAAALHTGDEPGRQPVRRALFRLFR